MPSSSAALSTVRSFPRTADVWTVLLNIEKSAFRKGEYVGYGQGDVWRITRWGKKGWQAYPRDDRSLHHVFAETLQELSRKIEGH